MKKINFENSNREKVYNWFKTFNNPTYGCSVKMNVTNLVNHCKETKESFFVYMLYIVVNGLNSIEALRIRYIDGKNILFDEINPSYTVMSNKGFFDNVRQKNNKNFKEFYDETKENVDRIKNEDKIIKESYNNNDYDYYFITCLPWLNFTQFIHPIPDIKESLSVPRICWGKYIEENKEFYLTLNITVNHMYVDGKDLSDAFNKIQELLDDFSNFIK